MDNLNGRIVCDGKYCNSQNCYAILRICIALRAMLAQLCGVRDFYTLDKFFFVCVPFGMA